MINPFRSSSSSSSALRSTVLAASLVFAALPGSAGAANASTGVSEKDIARVELEWTQDEAIALGSLMQLRDVLEITGKTDQFKTASNVYWLSARGIYASTQDCESAYDSLYRATVIGFQQHWPERSAAYTALSSHLKACVGVERRKALAGAALTSLNMSALQPSIRPALAEEAGLLEKAKDDSAAGPRSMKDISGNLVASMETFLQYGVYIGSALGAISIALTMFNAVHGGSSGSSSASGSTSTSNGGSSSTRTPSAPPANGDSTNHTTAPVRDKRPTQKNHVRKGRSVMQRLTPWR